MKTGQKYLGRAWACKYRLFAALKIIKQRFFYDATATASYRSKTLLLLLYYFL